MYGKEASNRKQEIDRQHYIDLRNDNIPQATDEGVIYADESGYRMLSGETSVVGGYTLVKTDWRNSTRLMRKDSSQKF